MHRKIISYRHNAFMISQDNIRQQESLLLNRPIQCIHIICLGSMNLCKVTLLEKPEKFRDNQTMIQIPQQTLKRN